MSPSCSTGPQSPVPPVCQMQLVPGTEQGQRADASAAARAAEDVWQMLTIKVSHSLQET